MRGTPEEHSGPDPVRGRRSPGSRRRPRRWQALVVVPALAAATWVLVPGAGLRSAEPDVARQLAALSANAQPCADPVLTPTAPVPDAVLRPGRVPLAGRTAAGASVEWAVLRPDGTPAGSGVVPADGADGTYAVQVDVPPGSWSAVTRARVPGGDPAACAWTSTTFSVSETVEGTTWAAGASGEGVVSGEFGAWRGSPVPVTGTWNDDNTSQVELWTLQPGGVVGEWDGAVDVAVGAIGPGESWAEAATGAYDARWAASLQEMARLREGRTGTTYVRFAHEMNGNWYPWSVPPESAADFVTAWQRYRALQQQWFPAARLVFSLNDRSVGDLDWRTLFPGSGSVDVLSISYFNHYVSEPDVDTFWDRAAARDSTGAPAGLQGHADFARSVGLPFAVSEWGPHAAFSDGRVYVEQMYQWFRANAGTGPGQLLYEVLFNVDRDDNAFALFPTTNSPLAAEAYQRLW